MAHRPWRPLVEVATRVFPADRSVARAGAALALAISPRSRSSPRRPRSLRHQLENVMKYLWLACDDERTWSY
jgi:hypothetical protein